MDRKRVILIVTGFAVSGGLVWFLAMRRTGADRQLDASGTVEATDAQLGFQAAGRIDTILVREGDRVKTGQELARLDQSELRARRRQAAAQLAAARAALTELERGSRSEEVQQGRDQLAAASQRLADARRDLARTKRLFDGGAVSHEALDKTQLAVDVAESQHDQAAQALKLLETGPRTERIDVQRATVAAAQGTVQQIDVMIADAVIRAPFDGVVTVKDREVGETASPGAPVLTITNLNDRWVRIYIPETKIGALQLGAEATITADTYKGRAYRGEVSFIASEAEFTPKNVQTKDERVKLVYAVKVRITGDPTYDLKPGIPADVHFDVPSAR